MSKGKVIFLNGVSSSGKTTIARALQTRLPEPYCWLSVDSFIDTIGKRFMEDAEFIKAGGYKWIFKAMDAFQKSIKVFSDAGLNVIADHVLQDQPMWKENGGLDDCLEILRDNDVLFVHVTCPVEELRRRETERGDRQIGQGEAQLAMLNPKDKIYDLTIDTYSNSIEECVDAIIALLEQPEKFTAFRTLLARRT